MSFLAWFNSLITFRKSSGSGFEVPRLDSEGRIRVSSITEESVVASGSSPTNVDGTTLWNNTTAGEEGLYFYDQTRGEWLSVEMGSLFWGEDTADGNVFEPVGVRTMSAAGGYRMRRDGKIVGISVYSDGGNAAKDMEVRINNVTPAALSFTTSGNVFSDNTLDIDFSSGDLINAGALPAGSAATDVTVILDYRWVG